MKKIEIKFPLLRHGHNYANVQIDRLTVANQQTRTSYRCPGFKFSMKNHESVPSGKAVVGNEALSFVRITGVWGDNLSRPRSSNDGSSEGMVATAGARKMVFSTLACTPAANSGSSSHSEDTEFRSILIRARVAAVHVVTADSGEVVFQCLSYPQRIIRHWSCL